MDTLSLVKEQKYNLFNKWCWENLSTTCKRMKLEHFLTAYTKINSKWIEDKCNTRNYKTCRGKHKSHKSQKHKHTQGGNHKNIKDINHSKILYDLFPRVMQIKAKINKWDPKLLHNEGNYKQGEKGAFRMGENNSK